MFPRITISILPLLLFPLIIFSQKTCYTPDGTEVNFANGFGYDYKPCIATDGIEGMCCALNRTGSSLDTCSSNGLCLSLGTYYRDFCTDETWSSPNCLPKTTCDLAAGGSSNGSSAMTLCTDGTWCCGANNNTNCCSKSLGFHLATTLITIANASSTTTSNSSCITSISNSSSTASSKSGNATTVGVAVGVSLGVLAIIGSTLGFWLGQRRGKRLAGEGHGIALAGIGNGTSNGGSLDNKPMLPYNDHNSPGVVHEISTSQPPAELGY